jgi:LacI family repressor for deo operon, udp, cdd, tsx, nupC, and nupG
VKSDPDPALPKYLRLKQDFEEQIRSGRLRAGEKLAPERELMKLHKVSYSTMTRAMVELRNDGLIERERGRGTFVRSHKAKVINIALAFDQVHRPTDPYLIPIVRGVGEAAGEHGFHWQLFPLVADCIFVSDHDTLFSRLLESRQIHGVLTCSPFPAADIARLSDLEIPTITVSNEYPAAHAPWVIEDVAQGVRDLVRHLVDELGHRRIALIMGPQKSVSVQSDRSSGLLIDELMRQLRQRGIHVPADCILHTDLLDSEPVTATVHRWLTGDDRPTAIFTAIDRHALEVLNVAAALGVAVPHEVSVASWYDEMEDSPLTCVRVPLDQMGREAVALLSRALAGEAVAPSVMPTQFMHRKTTSRAPLDQ